MLNFEDGSAARKLIRLTLIRAHVAAALVFVVRPRHATLIGSQQLTAAIGAATGVAGINRRTTS